MTEASLIDAIAALPNTPGRVLVGIGDDAAVWQPSRSHRSVVTTDALIEDVHFSRGYMRPEEIGWRAMTANVSDVAAMGARPRLATVALGIAPHWSEEEVLALYHGIAACAQRYGCAIAGGDLTRAPALTLSITAIGEVRATNLKLRSGARPGDVLAVTGMLGASRAGFDLLRGAIVLDEPLAREAREAHCTPQPRVAEGQWLGASRHVHAMMDCSDGLSTDLARLLRASHAGARLDTVPAAPSAAAAAAALGEEPERYTLAGGEEFELLVAVHPRAFAHLAARFRARFKRPLLRLGVVRADAGLAVVKQGIDVPVGATGWDHFH